MTHLPLQAGETLQLPSGKYLSCGPCFSENSRPLAQWGKIRQNRATPMALEVLNAKDM
jgi:hypothetical protein